MFSTAFLKCFGNKPMAKVQARWLASLSNGTIAIEGKNEFKEIANQPSPWQRLKLHLAKNKLHISGLRIQIESENKPTRTFNLPSLSPRQKWNPFVVDNNQFELLIPTRFDYFRRLSRPIMGYEMKDGKLEGGLLSDEKTEKFIEIHAIYKDFRMIFIVEETEGNESWCVLVPNKKI